MGGVPPCTTHLPPMRSNKIHIYISGIMRNYCPISDGMSMANIYSIEASCFAPPEKEVALDSSINSITIGVACKLKLGGQ